MRKDVAPWGQEQPQMGNAAPQATRGWGKGSKGRCCNHQHQGGKGFFMTESPEGGR